MKDIFIIALKEKVENPEFTEDGLLLPKEYFEIYELYYNTIIKHLEALNFDTLVHSMVGPPQGFCNWIGEATLVTWALSLKTGNTPKAFYPEQVASSIVAVTQTMLIERAPLGTIN